MCPFERRQSPLFVKTGDFVVWLLRHSAKFPKTYRQSLTSRLENSALGFQRCLGRAALLRDRSALAEADVELWQIRELLRTAHELNMFSGRLLEHAFGTLAELGRLLGAWRKKADGA